MRSATATSLAAAAALAGFRGRGGDLRRSTVGAVEVGEARRSTWSARNAVCHCPGAGSIASRLQAALAATNAMLQMKKIVIADLQKAFDAA